MVYAWSRFPVDLNWSSICLRASMNFLEIWQTPNKIIDKIFICSNEWKRKKWIDQFKRNLSIFICYKLAREHRNNIEIRITKMPDHWKHCLDLSHYTRMCQSWARIISVSLGKFNSHYFIDCLFQFTFIYTMYYYLLYIIELWI